MVSLLMSKLKSERIPRFLFLTSKSSSNHRKMIIRLRGETLMGTMCVSATPHLMTTGHVHRLLPLPLHFSSATVFPAPDIYSLFMGQLFWNSVLHLFAIILSTIAFSGHMKVKSLYKKMNGLLVSLFWVH